MPVPVFASPADLSAVLGTAQTPGIEDRLDLALVVATGWVGHRVGEPQDPGDLVPPYTVEVVACPPAWRLATIAAAVRFYRSPEVPFGVMQVGEYGAQVRSSIPEAEAALLGHRADFGLA